MKNDEVTFLLLNSAMMLYSHPSGSADTWFQGAPIDTKICRRTSPLHKMVRYKEYSWHFRSVYFTSVDMGN